MATSDSSVELNGNNYKEWSDYVENQLRKKNLWDGVTIGEFNEADPDWKEKNKQALQFIRELCIPAILSMIKDYDTASTAWVFLKHNFSPSAQADIEKGLTPLHRTVLNNDLESARSIMIRNPTAIWDTSEQGKIVLHIAVEFRNKKMVENFAQQVPIRLLEEHDAKGYTALALLANLTDNTNMAKHLITRSKALLEIPDYRGRIPVVLAAVRGHKSEDTKIWLPISLRKLLTPF